MAESAKVDWSKTPVETEKNVMERDFGVPWSVTAVNIDNKPNLWYPYMAERDGSRVEMDSDCVKFIVECVNRGSECLDAMMEVYRLACSEDAEAEPFKSIRRIAFSFCRKQLEAEGYVMADDEDKVAEDYIFGSSESKADAEN